MAESRRNTRNIGSYLIGHTLGEGAFGKVKLGTHIHTGEKVAIKILDKKKMQEDPDDIIRVQSEIAVLKKMRHKNIIQLYEIMESTRNIYLILEYCEEKELFDYINTRKRLTEAEALRFFQEIIDALDYLHCQNIVHRDLKPENLLLDYKCCLKLSDFGLSRTYTNDKLLSTPCGTPSYAPPEMLNGEEYHGLLSDIWSAGVILYAMLSGYLPFDESNEEINCQKIIKGEFEIPEWVSDSAADLIKRILVTDPYYRYDMEQIKDHPWFNWTSPALRPGVIIGYHKIPVDENILDKVELYGYNKIKTRENVLNNRFCVMTAIYYLILRKFLKDGGFSVSDLESDEYLRYIQDEGNVIEINNEENNRKNENSEEESENKNGGSKEEIFNYDNVDKSPEKRLSRQEPTRKETKKISIKSSAENENNINQIRNSLNGINYRKNSLPANAKEVSASRNSQRERKKSINKSSNQNDPNQTPPCTRNRSITTQDNYLKRFVNRKSLYIHDDLERFFKLNRDRRNSANNDIKSTILENIPKVSYVLDKFRRNTYGHDHIRFDEYKLSEILKLNFHTRNDSLKDNFGNLIEFQSKQRNSLKSAQDLNQDESNGNENQLEFTNNEELDESSYASNTDLDESAESFNSKKRSIFNDNTNKVIKCEETPNNAPNSPIKYNKAKTHAKTESKKVNQFTNSQNLNVSSFSKTKTKKLHHNSSRAKFILRSKSKSKYNVENLRPKIIFKREKIIPQSKLKCNTIKYPIQKKQKTILNNEAKIKNTMDNPDKDQKQGIFPLNEQEFTHKNKFIKGATLIKNDTSVEKSRSKTPCRNLSYSSHYAKKSRKDRVEELPWNLKKKLIEVENITSEGNNKDQFDAIKGIINRYEKFKQKHCVLKNTKNVKKNKTKKLQFKVDDNLTKTPQDAEEKLISDENRKSSLEKLKNLNQSQDEETPNRIKKFVCFEHKSSKAKSQRKNSKQLKFSNFKTISSTQFKTENKGNKPTPFRDNFLSQDSVFYTANHMKELFYKRTKIEFETKYKKTHQKGSPITQFEKFATIDHNSNKLINKKTKIFNVEDVTSQNLKVSYGPIDISTIFYCADISVIIEKLKEILNKKKIIYVQTNRSKFKCSKNGMSFEVKIIKLEDEENVYSFKYRMFQGGHENFRKLSQSILSEIF